MKTYSLGADMLNKDKISDGKKIHSIAEAVPSEMLSKEVYSLGEDHLLFKLENYRVFHAKADEIPSVMSEIGRLREQTYREVGEGTYKKRDTDRFDNYFHHLFIWDDDARKIAGAYRMGMGKEILKRYGNKGFYIDSLFKINENFYPVLEQSIELGRSFICKEYQRKPLSLFLLWKGILYFLIKHTEYRYLIGPVSISDDCSDFSKGLILEFLHAHHIHNELAKNIIPRSPFEYKVSEYIDTKVFLKYIGNDINRLDKFIHDIEPDQYIPVLLKKYIKQNAKILGANVDPKFNFCVDVLLLLDLKDAPREMIESLSKDSSENVLPA
jgi:putative hemolysin